jgi:hypothetical protein
MSLVLELEEKQKKACRQLLETLVNYLKKSGIENASLVDSDEEIYGAGGLYKEPIIKLLGQNIDQIRIHSADSLTCGYGCTSSRFQYEIVNKDISYKEDQKLSAKTKAVRSKSILGIPAGEIVDIKWAGNDLAQSLNNDSSISDILKKCNKSWKNMEFEVRVVPSQMIQIRSPEFTDMNYIQSLYATEHKESLEDCIFGFNIANKIAAHIKKLLG